MAKDLNLPIHFPLTNTSKLQFYTYSYTYTTNFKSIDNVATFLNPSNWNYIIQPSQFILNQDWKKNSTKHQDNITLAKKQNTSLHENHLHTKKNTKTQNLHEFTDSYYTVKTNGGVS